IPEPVTGRLAAMLSRDALPDHVVPPLAGRPMEAVREADERGPIALRGGEPPGARAPAGLRLIGDPVAVPRAPLSRTLRPARPPPPPRPHAPRRAPRPRQPHRPRQAHPARQAHLTRPARREERPPRRRTPGNRRGAP